MMDSGRTIEGDERWDLRWTINDGGCLMSRPQRTGTAGRPSIVVLGCQAAKCRSNIRLDNNAAKRAGQIGRALHGGQETSVGAIASLKRWKKHHSDSGSSDGNFP